MFRANTDGYNGFDPPEFIEFVSMVHDAVSKAKISKHHKGKKHSKATISLMKKHRAGKSMGAANSMSSADARQKVGLSKVGRKKRWNADGTYSYVIPENQAKSL